jgi:hypothetical protein
MVQLTTDIVALACREPGYKFGGKFAHGATLAARAFIFEIRCRGMLIAAYHGQVTETSVAEFLAKSGASPQYVALRQHLDTQGAVDTEE